MAADEIRERTQGVWDRFYSIRVIWKRSSFLKSIKGRLAFILISNLYRRMYADTGIATDSARVAWSTRGHGGWQNPPGVCLPAVPCRTCRYPPAGEMVS